MALPRFRKKRSCYCFQLGQLNGHLLEEELYMRFTVRFSRGSLSVCVCASFHFGFEGGM